MDAKSIRAPKLTTESVSDENISFGIVSERDSVAIAKAEEMSDRLRELTDAELEVVAGAGWGNVICRALMGALAGGEIAGPIGAIAGALICGGDAAIRDFG